MDIFGNAFFELRNRYIIPLISYGVKRKKYEFWNLKEVLTNNILSVNKISPNICEVEVPREDFMKSLVCEIELFYNKSLIQLSEHENTFKNQSTWSFVTLYYFLFFSSTTFSRLLHRGYIFLNRDQIKRIESYSLAVYSAPINLNSGNYFFSIRDSLNSDNIIVTLNFSGEGVHRLVLLQLEVIIRNEILPYADNNEKTILTQILYSLSSFNSEFPSILRNKLNYTGDSCFLDFEKILPSLSILNISSNFTKGILNLDFKKEVNNQITHTAYYAAYIFNYVCKMYEEYKNRSKFGKDFQIEREVLTKKIPILD